MWTNEFLDGYCSSAKDKCNCMFTFFAMQVQLDHPNDKAREFAEGYFAWLQRDPKRGHIKLGAD